MDRLVEGTRLQEASNIGRLAFAARGYTTSAPPVSAILAQVAAIKTTEAPQRFHKGATTETAGTFPDFRSHLEEWKATTAADASVTAATRATDGELR